MAELIGATAFVPPSLKQQILLFDRIAWPTACWQSPFAMSETEELAARADREFLIERGVVFAPDVRVPSHMPPHTGAMQPYTDTVQFPQWSYTYRDGVLKRDDDPPKTRGEFLDRAARDVAIHLRDKMKLNAVPLAVEWREVPDEQTTRADALGLVIHNLPVPGDTHSLEDVLAFRDQARSEGLIAELRVWMNSVAAGKVTQGDASDMLDALVRRYERLLTLEKMDRGATVVESLVVTTAEIAEYFVKCKWSELAKKLFEMRHKQIDLMKAEMALAGREVAYIVKAHERFGR